MEGLASSTQYQWACINLKFSIFREFWVKTPLILTQEFGLWFPILYSLPLACDFAVLWSWLGHWPCHISKGDSQGPFCVLDFVTGKICINSKHAPSIDKPSSWQPADIWAWQFMFVVIWWDFEIVIQNKQNKKPWPFRRQRICLYYLFRGHIPIT